MNKLARIFKHRWLDETDAKRALSADALARLRQRVQASEAQHSGEIRLCVEAGLPMSYLLRNAPPRERAVALFGKLRVWDTEHDNGVLIYLLLAEQCIEIVADRGVDRHVPAGHWQGIVGAMSTSFSAGRFEDGLNTAIDAVGELLVRHFPARPGDRNPNELPDEADVR
jgi:uncharacterized membrane protein